MDLFGETPTSDIEDSFLEEEEGAYTAPTEEHFVHPRLSTFLIGHTKTEQKLIDNIINEKMPHAIALSGSKGIGKATLAYRLARYILKHGIGKANDAQDALFGADDIQAVIDSLNVSADDPVFRRVASGGHPDFMSIERAYDDAKNRYKANVAVDEIRKATPFLRLTASRDGGWRVVLIDDADTMNRSAQNALLKILEEPPPRTLLLLITHRLGALIPTIRSRVRVLNMHPLSNEAMMELINKRFPMMPLEERTTLASLSSGSFGQALRYQEEGGLETLQNITSYLQDFPRLNWADIHRFADEIGGKGNDKSFELFRDIMLWSTNEIARAKARQHKSENLSPAQTQFNKLFENSSLQTMITLCETLQELYNRALGANLDKRQAVLSTFARLSEMTA